MDAHSVNTAARIGAPISGAASGLLFISHKGYPAWLYVLALTVSLAFGIICSIGRSSDRSNALVLSMFNAGALWIMAFVGVFESDVDLPMAMISALILGLVGSPAIDELMKRWGPGPAASSKEKL